MSVLRSENENLAAKVLSVLKISTDTIEKNKRVYLFKNLFSLHCYHDLIIAVEKLPNVLTVREDLLRAYFKSFYLPFCVLSDQ